MGATVIINCLESKPGEDGFFSSETKHDRRKIPTPNLLVSAWRLQAQKPKPRKFALGSNPREDVFCTLETNNDRTQIGPPLFVLAKRLLKQRAQTQKLSWV
jgi:hypothetical protein